MAYCGWMTSSDILIVERELLLPLADLRVPLGEVAEAGDQLEVLTALAGALEQPIQPAERVLHVAHDRQFHDLVLVDLRLVEVDVDDRPVLGELGDFARHAIVEPHADGEQQVGLVHRIVRVHGAVHAEPFQRKRMRLGEAADAHERGRHGDLRPLHELQQLGRRVAGNHAAAHIEHRLLRLLDAGPSAR